MILILLAKKFQFLLIGFYLCSIWSNCITLFTQRNFLQCLNNNFSKGKELSVLYPPCNKDIKIMLTKKLKKKHRGSIRFLMPEKSASRIEVFGWTSDFGFNLSFLLSRALILIHISRSWSPAGLLAGKAIGDDVGTWNSSGSQEWSSGIPALAWFRRGCCGRLRKEPMNQVSFPLWIVLPFK